MLVAKIALSRLALQLSYEVVNWLIFLLVHAVENSCRLRNVFVRQVLFIKLRKNGKDGVVIGSPLAGAVKLKVSTIFRAAGPITCSSSALLVAGGFVVYSHAAS